MIKFRRNCKRGEGRSPGTKGAQKHANSMACENFAAKIAPLRNEASFTNLFRSPSPTPCENFCNCETPLWAHECHFTAPHSHFAAAKWPAKMPIGYEISPFLRKAQPSLKFQFKPLNYHFPFRTGHLPCENPPLVRKLSQYPISLRPPQSTNSGLCARLHD